MIISVNGPAGSGKSTIAKMLAKKLGWPRYYIGGLRRQMAKKRGMTLAEYNELGENDPSTDKEVDEYQKKLGSTKDNFIIEGRTSWHFIPQSLKLYIDVNDKIASERIFKDLQKESRKIRRNEGSGLNTVLDVLASIQTRRKSDNTRYKKYYGIEITDKSKYDYILDTSNLTKSQVFEKILTFIKKNQKI